MGEGEEAIKGDMGYSGRRGDKRKMARDEETKSWKEKEVKNGRVQQKMVHETKKGEKNYS